MHASVLTWVEAVVDHHRLAKLSTLEVGSFNVNGSVRGFFTGPYVGVDHRPGPGVDKVAGASKLPFKSGRFDVVVSTEMLEHDPAFWLSVPEMARVLKPGGFLILTSRSTGFPIHHDPVDLWRFSPEAFGLLFELAELTPVKVLPDTDPASPGVFGLAKKETHGSERVPHLRGEEPDL